MNPPAVKELKGVDENVIKSPIQRKPANTNNITLEDPRVQQIIVYQLKNPLKPLKKPILKKIEPWITQPLKYPFKDLGGLSEKGISEAVEKNLKGLLKESALAKENARVQIRAVLATCKLYVKKNSKIPLTTKEEGYLKEGIKVTLVNGTDILKDKVGDEYKHIQSEDKIQTVKKGGKLLTSEFKEMMAHLFNAFTLSEDGPKKKEPKEEIRNPYKDLLVQTARICRKEELKEKERNKKLLPDIN